MARELNFQPLAQDDTGQDEAPLGQRNWRRNRRETNPVVQMSLRAREDVYERFRALCGEERRTNGDMLEVMMTAYLAQKRHEK